MADITFVRHAQTVANATGVWNGKSDGPLSEHGESTLGPLGERLSQIDYDVVVSSPLERTRRTAESFADNYEIDSRFIEIDLGRWEGWPLSRVIEEDGEWLDRAVHERDLPMGHTGETLNQAGKRVLNAVDALAARLGEDGKAAVVSHGGLLQAVLHRHLAGPGRRIHAFTANTGISRIVWQFGSPRLAAFNDVGHLGPLPATAQTLLDEGQPVLALVRHGRTRANVEGRWQGQGDWELDELGMKQAQALADWYGERSTVYASPLKRASTTAGFIARNGVKQLDDLMEISMGRWEGLTTEEILDEWPDLMETIYRHGVDLKRGSTGESFLELRTRVTNVILGLKAAAGETTPVVMHGGTIRSFISGLASPESSHGETLLTPINTSVSHVAMTDRGPEVLDYSVAAHLDDLT